MKQWAWIGMWLALGCGGDDAKPAAGGDQDAGGVSRDGGRGGDQPPVTGTTRDGGMGLDGSVGADGSTGEGGDAGSDGARVLSSLGAAERTALCRATVDAYFGAVTLEDDCALETFALAEDEADCKAQVSDCVEANRATEASDAEDALADCVQGSAKCDVTVETFQRCSREAIEAWDQIASAFACSEVGKNASEEVPEPKLSDECDQVVEACDL